MGMAQLEQKKKKRKREGKQMRGKCEEIQMAKEEVEKKKERKLRIKEMDF